MDLSKKANSFRSGKDASTRYREEIMTGITRISGFGKFGEFATFTLEQINADLLNEVGVPASKLSPDEIVAEHDGVQVAAVAFHAVQGEHGHGPRVAAAASHVAVRLIRLARGRRTGLASL